MMRLGVGEIGSTGGFLAIIFNKKNDKNLGGQ
jgi:hypothetical protein